MEKIMNFWHMQLHPNDPVFFDTERVKRLLRENGVIGFGEWEKGENLIPQFKDKMKIGDIIAIKKGGRIQTWGATVWKVLW